MEYDFAIVYFGVTRSIKKIHESHVRYIIDTIHGKNLTCKTFMHIWEINNIGNELENMTHKDAEHADQCLSSDECQLDNRNAFLETVNMDLYFYKDVWEKSGPLGEAIPYSILNHVYMLESQKRGVSMVNDAVIKGDTFKFVMFIRPDSIIQNELPIDDILAGYDKIHVPNHSHSLGINDQCAIMKYEYAPIYGNRIDGLEDFRKNHGKIIGEVYCKFIIDTHRMEMNEINFNYSITC